MAEFNSDDYNEITFSENEQEDLFNFSHLLIKCEAISNRQRRGNLLGFLPSNILININEADAPLFQTLEIIKACNRYPQGLKKLLRALWLIEQDSKAWFAVEGFLQRFKKLDDNDKLDKKQEFLEKLLADHSGFVNNRLESFVGREKELAEIRRQIAEKLPTGGYVTITGQAGQGKSSMIARLVKQYDDQDKRTSNKSISNKFDSLKSAIAHHFIPFNPGPDHQVGLLRNLIARLIMKHDLSEIYVASESRAALRDFFPRVLADLVAKGGQAIIFIDGLDQLEEELSGRRDLSFLPNDPPAGVVFVLGTRPDDTLKPLQLLKPHHEYKLPDISREDFGLVLQHRKVKLSQELANRFYSAMNENALYLDLVARELTEAGAAQPEEVIKRVADNPDNLFSLSIERFKRREHEWEKVLRPLLGVLLAQQEPLAIFHLRQILKLSHEQITDGLSRLGGLVAEDGQGRHYLFHSKLRDYLHQDKASSNKEYIFATDEEQSYHYKIVDWSANKGLEIIWKNTADIDEQGRRLYARHHYVTHLYLANNWSQLWKVLDEGKYGRAKLQYDPSMRLYAHDLYLGCKTAGGDELSFEEGINLLPRLWRYTLLRKSLSNQADKFPEEAFEIMALVGREQQALDIAELLTNPRMKAKIIARIGNILDSQNHREQEGKGLLFRSLEIAQPLLSNHPELLLDLIILTDFKIVQFTDRLLELSRIINNSNVRVSILCKIIVGLVKANTLDQALFILNEAVTIANTIQDVKIKIQAISEIANGFILLNKKDEAFNFLNEATQLAFGIQDDFSYVVALRLIASKWTIAGKIEEALELLDEIGQTALTITEPSQRAKAFLEEILGLLAIRKWERAIELTHSIKDYSYKATAKLEIIKELVKATQWELAIQLASSINGSTYKIQALQEIAEEAIKNPYFNNGFELVNEIFEIAHAIKDSYQRSWALAESVKGLARIRQWDLAFSVAYSITHDKYKSDALTTLARELIKVSEFNQIDLILSKLYQSVYSIQANNLLFNEVLYSMSCSLIQAKQIDLALELSNSITQSVYKISVLKEVANTLVEVGENNKGIHLFNQFLDDAQSIQNYVLRDKFLSAAVEDLVSINLYDTANKVTNKINLNFFKVVAKVEIAKGLLSVQELEQVTNLLDEGVLLACAIDNDYSKVEALGIVASCLAQINDVITTTKFRDMVGDDISYIRIIDIVIQRLLKAGYHYRAIQLLNSLKNVGLIIPNEIVCKSIESSIKNVGLNETLNIVNKTVGSLTKLVATFSIEDTIEIMILTEQWDRALEQTYKIGTLSRRVFNLGEIADRLIEINKLDRARSILEEAYRTALTIDDNFSRIWAIHKVIKGLVKVKEFNQIDTLLAEMARTIIITPDIRDKTNEFYIIVQTLIVLKESDWVTIKKYFPLIEGYNPEFSALFLLAQDLTNVGSLDSLLHLIQHLWLESADMDYALKILTLTSFLLSNKPEIVRELVQSFDMTEEFLRDL
jgi:hypothetical protein